MINEIEDDDRIDDRAYDEFVDECILCDSKEEAEIIIRRYGQWAKKTKYLSRWFEGE